MDPEAQQPIGGLIEKFSIDCGAKIQEFEAEICSLANRDRFMAENKIPNEDRMKITERRIQIGIHNGWTYVREPMFFQLTTDEGTLNRSFRKGTKTHSRSSSLDSKYELPINRLIKRLGSG